jgi:hypothetical protein
VPGVCVADVWCSVGRGPAALGVRCWLGCGDRLRRVGPHGDDVRRRDRTARRDGGEVRRGRRRAATRDLPVASTSLPIRPQMPSGASLKASQPLGGDAACGEVNSRCKAFQRPQRRTKKMA